MLWVNSLLILIYFFVSQIYVYFLKCLFPKHYHLIFFELFHQTFECIIYITVYVLTHIHFFPIPVSKVILDDLYHI